jgi:OmpA-OmpF porin, OOP family
MRSIDKYSVFSVFIALLLGLSGGGAAAQTKFILENQVTEEAMIRALKPAEPVASPNPESSGLTRSLKVTPHDPSKPGATSRKPAKPARAQAASGSAPVLLTFEPNATELTDKAKRALDIIARSLAHAELASLSFAIEGHADPRGNPTDNLKLSGLRAESVKTYLVGQHGIADKRLQVVGKGDTQLAVPQNPAAAENRRVTFVTLQ